MEYKIYDIPPEVTDEERMALIELIDWLDKQKSETLLGLRSAVRHGSYVEEIISSVIRAEN